jgi:hypothetical protein
MKSKKKNSSNVPPIANFALKLNSNNPNSFEFFFMLIGLVGLGFFVTITIFFYLWANSP